MADANTRRGAHGPGHRRWPATVRADDRARTPGSAASSSRRPAGHGFEGATAPPGGPHAEVARAGPGRPAERPRGATLYTTLEPCAHHGRTPPCVDAIIAAGVARVVVGVVDPDPQVAGRGVAAPRAAGRRRSTVGVGAAAVDEQLAPYLKHRRTGRPWVVLKLAATLDGRTAAPDGSSRWITGEDAAPTCTGCGRAPTPCWSGRAPSGPTTPR